MSAEDFQMIDDTTIDDSFLKTDSRKIYYHGAQVDDENKKPNSTIDRI